MTTFNPFARSNSTPFGKGGAAKKAFNPRSMDHLVTIVKVDGEAGLIYGVNSSGKNAVYTVDMAVQKRTVKRVGSTAGFSGAYIDKDMAKVFVPGHKVVAEKSKYIDGSKVLPMDGVEYTQYTANWIHNAAQGEGKSRPALMTASSNYKDQTRIASVQIWNPMAMDAFDRSLVQAAADLFEDRYLAKKIDKTLPSMGFMLRALRNGIAFGKPGLICFDSSSPQDFISIKDEEKWIYTGISGQALKETISAYIEYLGETYPGESFNLELMVYQSYFASSYSKRMAVGDFAMAPKKKMISRVSRKSELDERGFIGKNVAVNGIIVFVEDKELIDKVAKTFDTEKRDIVNDIHVNNMLYDIRSAVKSPTTLSVVVSEEIKVIITDPRPEDNPVVVAVKQFTPTPVVQNGSSIQIGKVVAEDMDDPFGLSPFDL